VNRRLLPWISLACAALLPTACDYGDPEANRERPMGIRSNTLEKRLDRLNKTNKPDQPPASRVLRAEDQEVRKTILDSVIRLIEESPTNPGGKNFDIAAEHLNQYFDSNPDSDFQLDPAVRDYLKSRLGEPRVKVLEERQFGQRDGRHIEDCLLYHAIAARVAGQGDDLSRARAVFDWIVRQIQLVPPGALGFPSLRLPHAPARPYDVLLRGMATEGGGSWSERSWLFMALCRQLGIDVGLLSYVPRGRKPNERMIWICGVPVGDQVYLFDARIGLPVPGPDGQAIATLEQAATNPQVLNQLSLPGQAAYPTTAADLAGGKITVLVDSSQPYFSSKMKLLQESLTGKNRMVLHRDLMAQIERFKKALGKRYDRIELWDLPIQVENQLFTNPDFMKSSQIALTFFKPEWPLLPARMAQLRGNMAAAMEGYGSFRLSKNTLARDKKTPIPLQIQQGLDMYATYFLALGHLDQNHAKQAEFMFQQTLDLMPEWAPDRPFYLMFRWGALGNLGRLSEAKGETRRAIGYYTQPNPTTDYIGNILRARDLVWSDPMAPVPEPLPPPPGGSVLPQTAMRQGDHDSQPLSPNP
jgi:hypothetical protein